MYQTGCLCLGRAIYTWGRHFVSLREWDLYPGSATCFQGSKPLPGDSDLCLETISCVLGGQLLPGDDNLYPEVTCAWKGLLPEDDNLYPENVTCAQKGCLCLGRVIYAWKKQLLPRQEAFACREPLVHEGHLCWEWATKGLERVTWVLGRST